ncbi:MAG: hypothetical protein M1814_005618 [Vezdaea aestivalis]|nr:MAG: hypothetical protein M1814_005618 [Vezdaea aestivalis]
MPYTPPAQQSPSTSNLHTPTLSRSHSSNGFASSVGSPARPELPRSASYLQRHRRTPSILKATSFVTPPPRVNTDLAVKPVAATSDSSNRRAVVVNGNLHQSPLPMTNSSIPSGAVMSPPDSSQSSSDEESLRSNRRGRQLANLAELQAAIRIIEQHRGSSPSRIADEARKAQVSLDFAIPALRSALKGSSASADDLTSAAPLSQSARKISHSRSSTESAIILGTNDGSSGNSDDEEVLCIKPPMIRKKSGELVKPALRPSFNGRRRPSSMPGTPTYGKAVHFDSHLEHVRHFLQVDRPLAVSAGSSPVESYESENEFPFSDEVPRSRAPPYEWEMTMSNFPRETFERHQLPIRLEKVFLSSDKKNLIGNVVVKNLSFQKLVVVRFTLDYWKTTSEVVAEFNNDIRRKDLADGHDRFTFNVKLADQANLEHRTMFFCVRYNVNGQEFWDNNGNINFQIDFKKQPLPQNGRNSSSTLGVRPLNSLPRSRPSPSVASGRPRSMPMFFDDFAEGFDSRYNFGDNHPPVSRVIGDSATSTIRLKQKTPASSASNSSLPFGNRYDFEASLSTPRKSPSSSERKPEWKPDLKYFSNGGALADGIPPPARSSLPATSSKKEPALNKPQLQSTSYNEFIDKYCFFGSVKSSPKAETPVSGDTALGVSPKTEVTSVSDIRPSPQPATQLSGAVDSSKSQATEVKELPIRTASPRLSRSSSPIPTTSQNAGSGMSSPVSFGYPFHHGTHAGFPFGDAQAPTAIRG